jgi:hypothetical protein
MAERNPSCSAIPAAGSSVNFWGGLFHGISLFNCDERGGERISMVLEQYSMTRFSLVVVFEVAGGERIELEFKWNDSVLE